MQRGATWDDGGITYFGVAYEEIQSEYVLTFLQFSHRMAAGGFGVPLLSGVVMVDASVRLP